MGQARQEESSCHPQNWLAWLTLHRAPGIGTRTLHRLLDRFGSPGHILDAGPGQWRALGLRQDSINWLTNPDRARLDADLRWLEQPDNHLVCLQSPDYPPLLTQIADRYTEEPNRQPEVTAYQFLARVAGRVQAALR